ncbi:hypothetical protein [Comamonas thiooxydans]|uniref:hypothetical protein n=2 Tax=Comamonas thiooxydans TaxID=363952 RepID=UPI001CCC7F72|nr:hypothetical protein [Comamonas thiooxydans]UBQ44025.1 hypothetical protein LCH15_11400 [Comamonas thiooxydans]
MAGSLMPCPSANESDMHFITRLARKYGAVATVKKNTCSLSQSTAPKPATARACPPSRSPASMAISTAGASSTRDAYDGVKVLWHDRKFDKRNEVIEGKKNGNRKTMKETFGSEADALPPPPRASCSASVGAWLRSL